ncbi:Nn.00g027930.m01.CDS01 [Neocucurbitaria sp. VM-36]
MIDLYQGATSNTSNPGLDLLRRAILSLSVTFFGSQHRQDRITHQGYHQYGEVLRQLNHHLTQPEQQLTNETLLTALSCTLLEVFLPTGPTNFLKHQRGIEAIMELRGPPTESEGTTATIFRGLRILSIVSALAESRSSIWAKKEWKQAPPAQNTEAGMLQHQIFDVLADCTNLISQRDALLATGAAAKSYEPLSSEVEHLLGDLEGLYPRWEELNRSQLSKIKDLSKPAKELGVTDHVSATAYMLYYTVYLCILQIKHSLSPSPDYVALRNAAAMKIARCLELKEYEMREGAPQSNTITFVATKVAWQALGGFNTVEGRRLAQVVRSAVNGVFTRPYSLEKNQTQSPLSTPDDLPFAQYVAAIPTTNSANSLNSAQMMQLWERQLDVFNMGHKQTSPPDPMFSLESSKYP